MKYGVLINKRNKNIGDDIQSYASSLFLPSISHYWQAQFPSALSVPFRRQASLYLFETTKADRLISAHLVLPGILWQTVP